MVELTWTVVVIHSDGCWFGVGNYSFAHLHRYDRTIAFCVQLKEYFKDNQADGRFDVLCSCPLR